MAEDWGGVMTMLLLVGGGIWIMKTHPELLQMKAPQQATPSLPTVGKSPPSVATPQPAAVSAAPAAAGKTIYTATGKTQQGQASGFKTRHYASGKPNDITEEWNAANCPFENYEMTISGNLGKPDHDDSVSMKMLGPAHKDGQGAWHIVDVLFNSGTFWLGHEKPHPKTSKDTQGKAMGSIVGKPFTVKAVCYKTGNGHHIEGWGLTNGQWVKYIAGDNPGGVFQKDANQIVQFRIDAAPQVKVTSAIVQEIVPPTGGVPAKTAAYSSMVDLSLESDEYRLENEFTFRKDCGTKCADVDFL